MVQNPKHRTIAIWLTLLGFVLASGASHRSGCCCVMPGVQQPHAPPAAADDAPAGKAKHACCQHSGKAAAKKVSLAGEEPSCEGDGPQCQKRCGCGELSQTAEPVGPVPVGQHQVDSVELPLSLDRIDPPSAPAILTAFWENPPYLDLTPIERCALESSWLE